VYVYTSDLVCSSFGRNNNRRILRCAQNCSGTLCIVWIVPNRRLCVRRASAALAHCKCCGPGYTHTKLVGKTRATTLCMMAATCLFAAYKHFRSIFLVRVVPAVYIRRTSSTYVAVYVYCYFACPSRRTRNEKLHGDPRIADGQTTRVIAIRSADNEKRFSQTRFLRHPRYERPTNPQQMSKMGY